MNISTIFIIVTVNFLTLLLISVVMLYSLKKTKIIEDEAAKRLLQEEEVKLHAVLDELSSMSSLLYTDIDKKRQELKRLIADAQDRIDILDGLMQKKIMEKNRTKNVISENKVGSVVLDKLHNEVYSLADKGLSVLEIAKILKKHKGEIELILNLREVVSSSL